MTSWARFISWSLSEAKALALEQQEAEWNQIIYTIRYMLLFFYRLCAMSIIESLMTVLTMLWTQAQSACRVWPGAGLLGGGERRTYGKLIIGNMWKMVLYIAWILEFFVSNIFSIYNTVQKKQVVIHFLNRRWKAIRSRELFRWVSLH